MTSFRKLPSFSREIKLSFHSDVHHVGNSSDDGKTEDTGIYLLQVLSIENQKFTVFYDNGCSDFIIKHEAAKRMKSNASQVFAGKINIGGVGDTTTQSDHGIYSVKIPLYNGNTASMSGICLDQITSTFPTYPLEKVEKDLHRAFKATGGDTSKFPKLPKSIGGEVDIMIGVKYLRYHPKPIFQMPSGLCIYESVFTSADGSRGVIGGPHQIFTEIHKQFYNSSSKKSFLAYQQHLFTMGYQVNPDVSLLGFKDVATESIDHLPSNINELTSIITEDHQIYHSRSQRIFEKLKMLEVR